MHLTGSDGVEYVPKAYGQQQADGAWRGWVEFAEAQGAATVLTDIETSQRDRQEVAGWASGLQTTTLQESLRRATYSLTS